MQLCNIDMLPFVFTRLLKALTLTRNALSLEMSPFVAVSSLVSSTLFESYADSPSVCSTLTITPALAISMQLLLIPLS